MLARGVLPLLLFFFMHVSGHEGYPGMGITQRISGSGPV